MAKFSSGPGGTGNKDNKDNKRALTMAAVGLVLLLIAFLGTHVLSGSSSDKAASSSIRSAIATVTQTGTAVKANSTVPLKPRLVTDPGPKPNTTRDPFTPTVIVKP